MKSRFHEILRPTLQTFFLFVFAPNIGWYDYRTKASAHDRPSYLVCIQTCASCVCIPWRCPSECDRTHVSTMGNLCAWSQGQSWRFGLKYILQPTFRFFDDNKVLRAFARNFVYSKEVMMVFFFVSCGPALIFLSRCIPTIS